MRESQAIELLSRKVSNEGYLTIPQVADGTGSNKRRTADALMIQTWPSRTISITGVEYKCSRGDWRRELKNGSKAESIAAYCNYWLVLAPKGIVPVEEVPNGWGLWEFDDKGRLLRTKAAPVQDDVKPLNLSFIAAVLRAAEKVNRSDAVLEADRESIHKQLNDEFDNRLVRQNKAYARLKEKVEEFEKASGLSIVNGWDLKQLGDGVQRYLRDPDQFKSRLKQHRKTLAMLTDSIDAALGDSNA